MLGVKFLSVTPRNWVISLTNRPDKHLLHTGGCGSNVQQPHDAIANCLKCFGQQSLMSLMAIGWSDGGSQDYSLNVMMFSDVSAGSTLMKRLLWRCDWRNLRVTSWEESCHDVMFWWNSQWIPEEIAYYRIKWPRYPTKTLRFIQRLHPPMIPCDGKVLDSMARQWKTPHGCFQK